MGSSYGFVEITGVTAAIVALDIMCKTSNIEFLTWERKLGGRLVTIVICGKVSAVNEAIEAACSHGIKKPAAYGVLANPHEEIVRLLKKSSMRFNKSNKPNKSNEISESEN